MFLKKLFFKEPAKNVSSAIEDITAPVNDVLAKVYPAENLSSAQKTKVNDVIQTVSFYLLAIILFALPLLFVPIVANWFDLPKQTFLLLGGLLVTFIWSLKSVTSKKMTVVQSIFDFPIIVLAVISGISAYLTVNRFVSITSDPIIYIGGALLFFGITQNSKKEEDVAALIQTLLFGGLILSLWNLTQVIGQRYSSLPWFALNFNPTGTIVTASMFLAIILPAGVGLYLKSKKKMNLLLVLVNLIGLILSLYGLYKFNPILLPFEAAWKIATGVLGQSLRTVFLGVGPSNFVDAFTQYRSANLNVTPLWGLRFFGGPFFLYILTTLGLAGFSAIVLLVYRILSLAKKRWEIKTISALEKGLFGSLTVGLAIFIFLPSPVILTATFLALLGLLAAYFNLTENIAVAHQKIYNLPENFVINSLIPLGLLALIIFAASQLGRVLLADYYFSQSLIAAQTNRALDTYNWQVKAINYNTANDSYRIAYSQTNLALADNVASQKDVTDQQKAIITELVKQAIGEARNAVALAPQRAANWENLSSIYRSLINYAQGADQWTLASLGQAISLDPSNPQLRFTLGAFYFANKDWQSAAQAFALATNLKPDYANAHYNLAQSLKALNLKDQAVKELQLTASLVCTVPDNKDCETVGKEAQDLGASLSSATGSANLNSTLSTPSAGTKVLPKAKGTTPKISTPSGEITQ